MRVKVKSSALELMQGDITKQDTEAVVNAANTRLAPGGGVAGAIHRAAGPQLWQQCKDLAGCACAEAKITSGFNLANRYIIHTVGPIYSGARTDARMLGYAYINSLKLADKNKIKSIAFPAISTGAFGYPLADAARIALSTIMNYLKGQTGIRLVRLVLYDHAALNVHSQLLKESVQTEIESEVN